MRYQFLVIIGIILLCCMAVPVNAVTWSAASGCWTATDGDYSLVMWNATGSATWVIPTDTRIVSYLVIAGGGGGGGYNAAGAGAGGGGGGGFVNGTELSVTGGSTVTIDVGAGGAGGPTGNPPATRGINGGNSTFHTITANGGGGGAAYLVLSSAGAAGGSGGGGAYTGAGGAGNTPSTIPAQGYNGGNGVNPYSGGGGGAGAAGTNGGSGGGAGGAGRSSSITGESVCYAGGGGGGTHNAFEGGAATCGGGTGGDTSDSPPPVAGTNGLGGGGGGAAYLGSTGAAGGSGVVIIKYVTGGDPPVASFTANQTEGAEPLPVLFTDTSIYSPASWQWGYKDVTGNDTWLNGPTTQNWETTLYIGNWSFNLTATNGAGSNVSAQTTFVNVSGSEVSASFTQNKTAGPTPLAIQFNDTSTSTMAIIDYRNWSISLPDNATVNWYNSTTINNLSLSLPDVGIHNVTLSITNISYALVSTAHKDITVNATLVADFAAAPLVAYTGEGVSFVDMSYPSDIYSWSWTFGDGGTSTERNPTHVYTIAGTKTVSLTVTNPDGSATETKVDYITVIDLPNLNPYSTFSFKDDVNIIDNQSPHYTRTIDLVNVTNASFASGAMLFPSDYIYITSVAANTTDFADCTLVSYSINNATGSLAWNVSSVTGFHPGTSHASILDVGMFQKAYTEPGTTTTPAWSGSGGLLGNSTYNTTHPVTFYEDIPLTYGTWITYSNFTISNINPYIHIDTVTFTPVVGENITSDRWLWDFGDGYTFLDYNGTPVTHRYATIAANATLHPSLTAYVAANTSTMNTTTLSIYPVYSYSWVSADFSGSPTSGSAGVSVSFMDLSEWGTTDAVSGRTYLWDFGDASTSNITGSTNHVYAGYGTYTVKLSVNNTIGLDNETKVNYIIVSASQQTTWYTPTQMRLQTVTNPYGTPIAGVEVTATPMNFTAPDDWAQTLIGVQPSVNMSGTTLYGVTGTDGSWVAPVLQSYLYHFTFVNTTAGINQESYFYPVDPYYRIFIDTGVEANYTYSQITGTNLTFSQPNASYITVGMNYQDASSLTENVTFTVEDWKNGTVFYTETFTSGFTSSSVSSEFTFPNTRGDEFIWKYVAYRADGSVLTQGNGGTSKGPSGVGVDLGLPLDWYRWISISIIFLIGSMSSQRTKQYWAILIPVFAAIFMWWGWFTGEQNLWGLVVLCAVFGVVIYMKAALREKHGVGGPGSMLINIVAFLIVVQACIGFVNGLNMWNTAVQVAVESIYQNVDITTDIPMMAATGGILGNAIAMSQIVFDMWFGLMKAIWTMLTSIVFIYPTIVYMFPFINDSLQAKAYLALMQVGIWIVYILFAYKFFRGELGTVEL